MSLAYEASPLTASGLPEDFHDLDICGAAIALASVGLYVFPAKDKAPFDPSTGRPIQFSTAATTDTQTIVSWFAGSTEGELQVAIACGPSGLVVVDEDNIGVLPIEWFDATLCALTREDKMHWYYRLPEGRRLGNSTGSLPAGFGEIRAGNAYVIAPPSVHSVTGKQYQFADLSATIATLPDEIASRLPDAQTAERGATSAEVAEFIAEHTSATHPHLIKGVVKRGAELVQSGQSAHETAVELACWAARGSRAGAYPAGSAFDTLERWFLETLANRTQPRTPGGGEWQRILAWAVAQANVDDLAELRRRLPAVSTAIDAPTTTSMGDWSAKRADIRHAEHSHPPPNVDPTTGEVLTNNLPSSFWEARPELAAIRQAAHACGRPADAVFGASLARISAMTPPTIQGPAPVGTPCSLNIAVALIGQSGAGKSSGASVAASRYPFAIESDIVTHNLGSGEGVAEAFIGSVEEIGEDGKKRRARQQVRRQALFMVDEGQALAAMAQRQGTTIMSVFRSMWSGEALGQQNGTDERTRRVPAGEYRAAILAGFQPSTAVAMVDDLNGTAQRWCWFSATDPTIPDDFPEWPGSVDWKVPHLQREPMSLAPDVVAEIRARAVAVSRGTLTIDPLDAHRDLSRLKVAALLALLAGRLDITEDDWRLSGVVLDTSDRVRHSILAAARDRAAEAERSATARVVGRAVAVATSEETRALNAWSFAIGRHVAKEACDGGCKRRCLTRAVPGKYRDHVTIDAAIDAATEAGWIVVDGDTYRPGSSRPAPSGGRS